MQQDPQIQAIVTGHTDNRGTEEANRMFGQRRADAVMEYLVNAHNINAGRIETRSAGQTQPIGDNTTAEGQRANRRAEIDLFVP